MAEQSLPEESIFGQALEIESAVERAEFLDQACRDDPALRAAVEELLRADARSGDLLDLPEASAATIDHPAAAAAGDRIGPYKLVEVIGEGGMGVVYLAQQTEPVKRLVALKVIKAGMDSKQVLARFEAERQALALMDHPNIARVLDAGTTSKVSKTGDSSLTTDLRFLTSGSGRPYFVMELVKGVPITKFCDERRLTPRERLELFVPVCHAIQHAHQKGIIHRDLKPNNVLVALYDGKPVPKVIDFGVAKAAGQPLTEKTLVTGLGAIVGTPEYMSPEQAELNQLDIDTRSDIYSLGVLLYELLTGTPPLTRKRIKDAALLEVLRVIREEEPQKPSTRISTTDELPSIAANRGTEPARLSRLMRGELDWIVMKALEKDRSRRYETANGFAMDVQRYLADEPVSAGPPSAAYRFRKFVHRHRLLLATTAAFIVLLVAGAAAATWQAVRATRAEGAEGEQRKKAERNEANAKEERNKAVEAGQKATAALKEERFTSYTHRLALAHRERLAGEVAWSKQLLGDCPVEFRDWEWRYVRRLCNSELLAFRNHVGPALAVAFSPDGTQVASASRGEVRVWEAATGREVFRIPGTTATGLSFHPNGRHLAVAWAERVTVHDAADGTERLRIEAHDKPSKNPAIPLWVTGVAYSPDGKRLATVAGSVLLSRGSRRGGEPATLKVWDSDSGQELLRFADPSRPLPRQPNGVAFSPDGSYLAVSMIVEGIDRQESGDVDVRDAADGRLLHTLRCNPLPMPLVSFENRGVTGVAFSPDSRRVGASGADGAVRIWELPAGRPVQTLLGFPVRLNGLTFSPAGERVAAAGGDRVVRVWDTTTGLETDSLFGHTQVVYGVAFSPDGRRIASAAGEVRVWDAAAGQQARVFRPGLQEGQWAIRPPFSPDGKFLALVCRASVRVREIATGAERRFAAPIGRDGPIGFREMVFSPDGRTFATTAADGVRLWDLAAGAPVRLLPIPPKEGDTPVTYMDNLAFSPDGRHLATYGSSILTVWETATGRIIHKIRLSPPFDAGVGGITYRPDGRRIAVVAHAQGKPREAPPAEIKVWDAESGQQVAVIPGGGYGLAFSRDGTRLASGNSSGAVTIWDATSGAVVFTLRGHTASITDVEFSRDGRRLVTASADQTVRLWDPSVGKEVLVLRGHTGKVVGARFSPDGHYLASVCLGQPEVRLWDARPVEP
jgi:WD40 repeat protein/serine/threonine protein kinase